MNNDEKLVWFIDKITYIDDNKFLTIIHPKTLPVLPELSKHTFDWRPDLGYLSIAPLDESYFQEPKDPKLTLDSLLYYQGNQIGKATAIKKLLMATIDNEPIKFIGDGNSEPGQLSKERRHAVYIKPKKRDVKISPLLKNLVKKANT